MPPPLTSIPRSSVLLKEYLPAKVEQVVFCKMSPLQGRLYKAFRESVPVQNCLAGGVKVRGAAFVEPVPVQHCLAGAVGFQVTKGGRIQGVGASAELPGGGGQDERGGIQGVSVSAALPGRVGRGEGGGIQGASASAQLPGWGWGGQDEGGGIQGAGASAQLPGWWGQGEGEEDVQCGIAR